MTRYQMSEQALNLLKQVEELRLTVYDDQTGKETQVWTKGATIGYGHLINKAEWDTYKDGITESAADSLFQQDLAPFIKIVSTSITIPLKPNEFDALVILAYNIGAQSFQNSSVVKLVNDSNAQTSYKNLEEAWKAWNKSQGKVMKGLINRRQCEWDIYSKNIYQRW
ncbi:MAG: lysozyme [Nitrosomonas sp.]|nr:lysozyme [Nitrosomonas sp.]MBP6075508.1 lysozyme [Nitrosomonas sp.]